MNIDPDFEPSTMSYRLRRKYYDTRRDVPRKLHAWWIWYGRDYATALLLALWIGSVVYAAGLFTLTR